MEIKLRHEAKELLGQGKVDYIIGFEPGSLNFTTTPLITKDINEIDRLIISPFIVNNLANLLTEIKGRVGIVVKGCDSRSIVSLIQDNKVVREDVVILGVPCQGIIDLGKVERLISKERDQLNDIIRKEDKVVVTVDGKRSDFPIEEVLFDNCLSCESPTPQECDILLGEPVLPTTDKSIGQRQIYELNELAPQQRWDFWANEFDRCIRCYACRNICPACFCHRCFVEETEPQWIFPAPRWQDNLIFQVIRNIHVAGRCTDCGECERSCPVNIPLRSLARGMYDVIDELFHFKAGMDKEALPLMAHYEQEEAEDFFR